MKRIFLTLAVVALASQSASACLNGSSRREARQERRAAAKTTVATATVNTVTRVREVVKTVATAPLKLVPCANCK